MKKSKKDIIKESKITRWARNKVGIQNLANGTRRSRKQQIRKNKNYELDTTSMKIKFLKMQKWRINWNIQNRT